MDDSFIFFKRRCYGLDNARTLFQRLWLDLEGYRLFAAA
jgi:hypothetical protein